jgi:glucosamine--fructose-6-phosphate aminotransferase (isomerizing)
MCGIIAYIGDKNSVQILMEGLKRLEYRGYDSCGLAVMSEETPLCVKTTGRIINLEKKLANVSIPSQMGIAHTRWATHGKPSEENAHPHFNASRSIFVIHNGIIENYAILKRELLKLGYTFTSETDTEVIAHLIEEFYQGELLPAVLKCLDKITGTFGLAVFHTDEPDKIVLARRGSPLVIGLGRNEMLAASDVNAILRHTDKVIFMDDDEVAVIRRDGFQIMSLTQEQVHRTPETVEWRIADTEKDGYPHYMLKEIYEQPETVLNAFRGRIIPEEGVSKLGGLEPVIDQLKRMKRLIIVACGTSYHAGLLAQYMLERMTDIDVDVEIASEFRYRNVHPHDGTVVLAISQSGETADSIAALREARRKGALTLGLVNTVGSTIARETVAGIYNHAGPEIGVASTKIFTSQVVILALFALLLGRYQKLAMTDGAGIIRAIQRLPDQIAGILEQAEHIRAIAQKYYKYESFLFIGRMCNYPTALEGALKLKEISYIHAEGYAAGEMKHGPIALVSPQCPVVAICPQDSIYEKTLSNIKEVEARSAHIVAICNKGDDKLPEITEDIIEVPSTVEFLNPVLCNIPLQLLAYYCAMYRGCEIDKPRNLAKSVTVE